MGMVGSADQYGFIYRCLCDYLDIQGTVVPLPSEGRW